MGTKLLVNYDFADSKNVGKDSSGNGFDAEACGSILPKQENLQGRNAVTLAGGDNGTSFLKIPAEIFDSIGDDNGITVTAWINIAKNGGVWERIFDFGKGEQGPYLFLTRNLRGVCFAGADIAADPVTVLPTHEWVHIAMSVEGTKGGTMGSAGPVVYINGELAADGRISQTTSGMYGKLRQWFAKLDEKDNFVNNFIGKSQFGADADFGGSLSDFRIYEGALSENDILELMCESVSDEDLVKLAVNKYLKAPAVLAVKDYELPDSFLNGKISVKWTSDSPEVIADNGKLGNITKPQKVVFTAKVSKGSIECEESFEVTALPKETVPYGIKIHANDETMPVSETLFGLFYEDINNAADGGIYAEQIQNRSFENFHFAVYNDQSGVNGASSGRVREPLEFWFGDTDRCTVHFEGGLNEQLGIKDADTNNCYISVEDGTVISNRGFCDNNHKHSIIAKRGDVFDFTIWARAKEDAKIGVFLKAEDGRAISETAFVNIESSDIFVKYGVHHKIQIKANYDAKAELVLSFHGAMDIDMVSLMPEKVWGSDAVSDGETAHANYLGNPNYRLRPDMVKALKDIKPSFLRFPGGCISEGSYIWENVYDWKDSVGPVETRKENFNVWGYVMTLGLGYMEYFQLAEDLNATPLPVMACGVLCQARSDYANPAGGELQQKYINNFIDLIDFAISTDFENNIWAKLRKDMGHEKPFDLHYLGVGNENWGTEFMASFETFYKAIDDHMKKVYPNYPLTIVSTVGAQADDDAFRLGWKFLRGRQEGAVTIDFTDGSKSFPVDVDWYKNKDHYMDTIADEHYYRPNEYLVENADRYEFYERAYKEDGSIDDERMSKVFVGEYASSDKNTMAGAAAEAAVMTGFENNSDVVRLAATAPLFNKVLTDGQYRWTPDCIWFDNESLWRTPTYYVQQMFAANLGKKVVSTEFETYEAGEKITLRTRGGVSVSALNSDIAVKEITVKAFDGTVLLQEDFTKENTVSDVWNIMNNGDAVTEMPFKLDGENGLVIPASVNGENGIFCVRKDWRRYTVEAKIEVLSGNEGFALGAGITDYSDDNRNALLYSVGLNGDTTGIRVFKNGREGYTMGDFSSSICAGNLRSAMYEKVENNTEYTVIFDYGMTNEKELSCGYESNDFESMKINARLLPYCRDVFHSVTKDDNRLYCKVVNTEDISKRVSVAVEDMKVKEKCEVKILAAADAKESHVQNINVKNSEHVVPVTSTLKVENNSVVLTLPAQSVAVVIFEA